MSRPSSGSQPSISPVEMKKEKDTKMCNGSPDILGSTPSAFKPIIKQKEVKEYGKLEFNFSLLIFF